jgi:hypothetical protein
MAEFYSASGVPTNSCLLLDSRAEAEAFPTGEMRLGFCDSCGFISNLGFDVALAEYSGRYEETQAYSPVFVDFARDLANHWVDKYDLAGKDILEVGCGKGEFLTMMIEGGAGTGIGIDPGVKVDRIDSPVADRLTWIADFYSESYEHLEADALVCRHTLEHISPVGDFMRMIRANIGDRTDMVVLFELPDVLRVLREVAFWDVYYEHCSYFSLGSLARLFRATGFDVLDLSMAYDDQYLLIEARPSEVSDGAEPSGLEDDSDQLRNSVGHFVAEYESVREKWSGEVAGIATAGKRAVIWGAGSKGVAFLTNLGLHEGIEYAVDINPHKQGKYMAGTGQKIVSPEFLVTYRPDKVIVMNPIYMTEISDQLHRLGLNPEVVAV